MTLVRRVRADEWREVRALRLQALTDAAAPIAFLDTLENATARPDGFWQERTTRAADTRDSAQFVAIDGQDWVGSVSVIRRAVGDTDHHGRPLEQPRSDVVGVYVRPSHRGQGVIDSLLVAASDWASALGDAALTLDVHADNDRAQNAYLRAGFALTGFRFTGPIGQEVEMARSLEDTGRVRS
ncbi:GNAT family N-acetyltransferase [Microbacterium sp. NPDC056234]|uniref:GNAT family N-acetyltransferase n=1 Tax=Microbacterium sp. NPDC056234 TaxID=3345757 RepID=UPI0035D9F7A5